MALATREFSANARANIQYLLYVRKNPQMLGFSGFGATNGLDDLRTSGGFASWLVHI